MSEYLSTKEVADMLGVSTAILECRRCKNYKLTANGKPHPLATLPYLKIGQIVRYKKSDVLALIDNVKVVE